MVIVILFTALLLAPALQAQEIPKVAVEGVVIDAQTGGPLAGANVFVDGTTLGAATGANGRFRIEGIPVGRYRLVASMIGYSHETMPLRLTAQSSGTYRFQLEPNVVSLKEVTVTGEHADQWWRRLARFKRLFFGTSRFAEKCLIENRLVLDFETSRGLLYATAPEPLEIVNEALGYRITFYLSEFRGDEHYLLYEGSSRFERLTPEAPQEAQQWEENRRIAYRGSLRHFLDAVGEKRLEEEGFAVAYEPIVNSHGFLLFGLKADSIMAVGEGRVVDTLLVPDELTIAYSGEHPASEYRDYMRSIGGTMRWGRSGTQYSWITLQDGWVVFDAMGHLRKPTYVTRKGYWSWDDRVATLLPMDYKLEPQE